jgi:Na+-driven multidrug efflux pump
VFVKNRSNLPVSLKRFRPDGKVITDILAVGIPSALTQATTSVVSGIVNKVISRYGSAAISVYGGYSKISSFGTLPVFGVTRGMTPILGYSYGAKNKHRFLATRRIAIITAFIISSVAGLFFVLMPQVVLNMINATDQMRELGMTAYRILGISLFISGVAIVFAQSFPPAKRSYLTLTYTIARQVGLLIPIISLFSKLFGVTGVWWSYVVTDYMAFGIVLVMSVWFRKKVLDTWPDVVDNDNVGNKAPEESNK